MDTKKYFVRDGLETYSPDEVEKIEQVSKQQLERDLRRAFTWADSGDFEKAAKIVKPFESIVGR